MAAEENDALTREQFRWLVVAAIAIGALVLLAIVGLTAISVIYGFGADTSGTPSAAFDVETTDRGDSVAANVTHAGGDGVDPASLVIEVNEEPRGTWEELGGEGLDVVAPGHQLVLTNVSAGDSVAVVWIGDDDDGAGLGGGTIGTD